MNRMSEDEKIRNFVMRAMAECAYEFSKAPEEDQPLIINQWVDNLYALVKTMIVHDSSQSDTLKVRNPK